ncbi:MAG: DUF302 domain-containing protein [Alphaproteobacteria bacterium]
MPRLILPVLAALMLFASQPAAETAAPYSGTKVVDTGQPFAPFVTRVLAAVRANGLGVVAQACANCGAKSIGVTIPGNRVIMVFHPKFAVRMLKASVAAGIEAPLRLYVTERPGGLARLTYRLPSHVFAPYGVAALDAMAKDLDGIFARITRDVMAAK